VRGEKRRREVTAAVALTNLSHLNSVVFFFSFHLGLGVREVRKKKPPGKTRALSSVVLVCWRPLATQLASPQEEQDRRSQLEIDMIRHVNERSFRRPEKTLPPHPM
jgi:hypothetical protein